MAVLSDPRVALPPVIGGHLQDFAVTLESTPRYLISMLSGGSGGDWYRATARTVNVPETMTRPVSFLDVEDTDELRAVAWVRADESDDEW
jgi:hypothetical protein